MTNAQKAQNLYDFICKSNEFLRQTPEQRAAEKIKARRGAMPDDDSDCLIHATRPRPEEIPADDNEP